MISDRRQQILEVAKELFLHYGYKKVTLVDIARELGVSRPTVYQAFPNKEEIFKAIVEAWSREALVRIQTSRRPELPVREQLQDAIDIWLIEPHQLMQSSPNAQEMIDCSYGFARETVDEGFRGFTDFIEKLLADAEVDSPLPAKEMAHFLSCSLRGFKALASTTDELQRLVRDLLSVTLR